MGSIPPRAQRVRYGAGRYAAIADMRDARKCPQPLKG